MEPAAASVDVQNQFRLNRIAVVDSESVGLICFGTPSAHNPVPNGSSRQIQQVEEVVASKNMLLGVNVLIHTAYVLVGIAARRPGRCEVLIFTAVRRHSE